MEPMAVTETTTLTIQIEPGLKEALRTAATRKDRSIANKLEVLIRDWSGRNRIAISQQEALFDEDRQLSGKAGAYKQRRKE